MNAAAKAADPRLVLMDAQRALSRGNPHEAHAILTEAIDENGLDVETELGFACAQAKNWLDNGSVIDATTVVCGTLISKCGAPPLSKPKQCALCGGTGMVSVGQKCLCQY